MRVSGFADAGINRGLIMVMVWAGRLSKRIRRAPRRIAIKARGVGWPACSGYICIEQRSGETGGAGARRMVRSDGKMGKPTVRLTASELGDVDVALKGVAVGVAARDGLALFDAGQHQRPVGSNREVQ